MTKNKNSLKKTIIKKKSKIIKYKKAISNL